MSKKYVSLILLLVIAFSVTGCNDVIELTDTESTLIAEYAADLLLKYDVNHNDRLYSGEKEEQEMLEEAEEDELNGIASTITEEASEEQLEETSTEAEDNNGRNLNSNIDDISSMEDDNVTDDSSSAGSESDLAKILGIDGVSITYKDYLITDHYPATDADGEFIYLDATEGYQLLVLRFDINNTSSESASFTMLDKDVDYRIVCNNKNAANPMLTILLNDLGTMEAVVSPEESEEGVLIFQISNDMKDKLSSMFLKVQHNGTENIINIL